METSIDTNSIWADPKLLDPSTGKYVLGIDSPALGLGIQQIQLDNFGFQENVYLFYNQN